VAAIVLGLAVGSVAAWHQYVFGRAVLLVVLTVVVLLPIAVRVSQRRFDPFEPATILAVGLLVLFVGRPVAQVISGDMLHRAYDTAPGFDKALVMALVGTVALWTGYATAVARRAARSLPMPPKSWRPATAGWTGVGLVLGGLVLYAAFLASVGGGDAIRTLLTGRSGNEGATFRAASAYLDFGPFLAVPAALLLLESRQWSSRPRLFLAAACVALAVVMVAALPRGGRLWLLAALVPVVVLPYLRAQRRPHLTVIGVAGVIVFAFGVSVLAEVRDHEARASLTTVLRQTAENPLRGGHRFILGNDTEMFAIMSIAGHEVPERVPHAPGVTVASLLANPVPNSVWPGKPQSADIQLYEKLFPREAAYNLAGTAPSMFGGFYYDSGFLGIVVGAFLVGLFWGMCFVFLKANPENAGVRLLYASLLPFTIILLRGNPTDSLARALYVTGPLVAFLWVVGWRQHTRRLDAERRAVRRFGT
jgi:hypothetical protein